MPFWLTVRLASFFRCARRDDAFDARRFVDDGVSSATTRPARENLSPTLTATVPPRRIGWPFKFLGLVAFAALLSPAFLRIAWTYYTDDRCAARSRDVARAVGDFSTRARGRAPGWTTEPPLSPPLLSLPRSSLTPPPFPLPLRLAVSRSFVPFFSQFFQIVDYLVRPLASSCLDLYLPAGRGVPTARLWTPPGGGFPALTAAAR